MKDVYLSTGHSVPLAVTGAILLYSSATSTDSPFYATAHPVTIKGKRPVIGAGRPVDREALFTALDSLARMTPRQAEMVESRFFGGLDIPETAALLEVSEATVLRDWRAAKAWLANELRQNS